MSPRRASKPGVMLDLWRPPQGAGDPVGCLATTYTFHPGLFDEQCLARFLDIDSEPNREDLAFLLERENRLGPVYAAVLVDHTQAGVEHSYRWDVLPVHVRGAKQHAKVSLLAWDSAIRIIVASANLSEPGYRTNYEVAGAVDLSPTSANLDFLDRSVEFLRDLLRLVPGASHRPPPVRRAEEFLAGVTKQSRRWSRVGQRAAVRQLLVCTAPAAGPRSAERSSLEEAISACRGRGASPKEAWIASPFFDDDQGTDEVASALCKALARGERRRIWLCVPAQQEDGGGRRWRIAAPKTLLTTAQRYGAEPYVEVLPSHDADKNARIWHAKILALRSRECSALMTGSSNFTTAGMGVGRRRNTEANLLTVVQHESFGREKGQLDEIWPDMAQVREPDQAEWRGPEPEQDEEEQAPSKANAAGFVAALYRAGDTRQIVLRLEPAHLPRVWQIRATGQDVQDVLSSTAWKKGGHKAVVEIEWKHVQPPEKLVVEWEGREAFLPINVEDKRLLPPPAQLERMTADDMLGILAATDPSAAFRAWSRGQQPHLGDEDELDAAVPIDLDPLRRFDLYSTFLHRVRRRARVLAQLRANLERPVSSRQSLEWRLKGMVGIQALAERLIRELVAADGAADEALLTLADFLIVLKEVNYSSSNGALPKKIFDDVFSTFLRELAVRLGKEVSSHRPMFGADALAFWERVVRRCQE